MFLEVGPTNVGSGSLRASGPSAVGLADQLVHRRPAQGLDYPVVMVSLRKFEARWEVQAGGCQNRREVSLDDVDRSLDRSAVRLGNMLAGRGESPSSPAHQRERALEIADKLAQLRPDYREVIVLRNLEGLSFDEVAERMDRKPGAVRMLWLRAIEKFRQTYEAAE